MEFRSEHAAFAIVLGMVVALSLFGYACQRGGFGSGEALCRRLFPDTGAAIVYGSNSSAYCWAGIKCYGDTHVGLQGAQCEWRNVVSCGTNSTCPAGSTLIQSCAQVCSDNACQPCQAACTPVVTTPVPPTPVPVSTVCSQCGAAAPAACNGQAGLESYCIKTSYGQALSCARALEPRVGYFFCPRCPAGTSQGQCTSGGVFGWQKTVTCFEAYQTGCEQSPTCAQDEAVITRSDCAIHVPATKSCCDVAG
jgi:hypothetical protein